MKKFIEALEISYMEFNKILFEDNLPSCVINIQYEVKPPKNGYTLMGAFYPIITWDDNGDECVAISVTPNAINSGKVQVLSTLVHEMVHVYCHKFNIEDCVKGKHNTDFKEYAEMAKLEVEKDKKVGWGMTYPTSELLEIIESLDVNEDAFELSCEIKYPEKVEKPKKPKKPKIKYACPSCGRKITAEEEIQVTCKVCDVDFIIKEGK